jgi:hypothetical protein
MKRKVYGGLADLIFLDRDPLMSNVKVKPNVKA